MSYTEKEIRSGVAILSDTLDDSGFADALISVMDNMKEDDSNELQ